MKRHLLTLTIATILLAMSAPAASAQALSYEFYVCGQYGYYCDYLPPQAVLDMEETNYYRMTTGLNEAGQFVGYDPPFPGVPALAAS